MIYYLYYIKGIEKVESNFYEIYNNSSGGETDYNIEICYDPKIISKEKWKKIEKDIDIYL